MDAFFSNTNTTDKENSSSMSLYSITYLKEGQKLQQDFEFQIKVDLPQTTKHLKLTIEKDQDEIANAMTDENLGPTKTKTRTSTKTVNSKYSAGVNYLLNSSTNYSSMVKFGLRIDMPLNPSIKYRIEKNIDFKLIDLNLSQDFILYRQEGISEVSSLTLSREWNDSIKTDLVNNLAWSDSTDYFQLRNNFLFYKNLGDEKTLTYSAAANARLSPIFNYESYDTSLSYRQKIIGNWIYFALSVGSEFLKENHFNMENFIQLRFELFLK